MSKVPSAVITESQNRFYQLKDALKPAREAAEAAKKAADAAASDAAYAEHKVHSMAWWLDEVCETTDYFLGVVSDLTISKKDCSYCAEDDDEEPRNEVVETGKRVIEENRGALDRLT